MFGQACDIVAIGEMIHNGLLQAALTTFDKRYIDILVSNAAVNPAGGPILQMEDSVIEKILQINIQSAIWLVREAVKHMTAGGSIVLNSSFSAFNPMQPLAMYAVSKTALVSFVAIWSVHMWPSAESGCATTPTHPPSFYLPHHC